MVSSLGTGFFLVGLSLFCYGRSAVSCDFGVFMRGG